MELAWKANARRLLRQCTAMAVALLAAPSSALATAHVLVWANGQDVTALDPLVPGTSTQVDLSELTMAYLTHAGDGPLKPELALQVPTLENGGISVDGKTITFHLRPGLRWSDGAPLTSDDVAFSVGVVNDPKVMVADREGFRDVTSVETPDSTTVVIHVARRQSQIARVLFSDASTPVLPRHLLGGKDIDTSDYMRLPVGAGPFRYSKWVRGDRVELERNPYYFRGQAKLGKIVFRMIPSLESTAIALRTGEIDLWPHAAKESADQFSDDPSIRAAVLHDVRPQVLIFNMRTPPFDDVAVRSALRLSLNRQALITRIYHGGAEIDESILSSGDPGYSHEPVEAYDPTRAKALLDAAGWKVGAGGIRTKGGEKLSVSLVGVAGNVYVDEMFELIRADWEAVGVEVDTRTVAPGLLFSRDPKQGILQGGKFGVALYSLGQFRASDLESFFACKNAVPSGANVSGLCDRKLDALFAQDDAATGDATSAKVVREIQERLNVLLPAIIVVKRDEYFLFRKTVTGFKPSPFAAFAGIINVDVR